MADKDDTQQGKMSREEAGHKGGEATLKKHGPEFYSEIGQKQGKENNPGNFANRDDAAEAGRRGGEARRDGDEDQAS